MHDRPHAVDGPLASSAASPDASLVLALALTRGRGLGPVAIARLRAAFDDDAAILAASPREISCRLDTNSVAGRRIADALAAVDPWPERRRMRRGDAILLTPRDAAWPPLLRLLDPPPPALWCHGASVTEDRTVAIVGSRRADEPQLRRAGEFAAALAADGWMIVSGGAFGVDAAAHRGSLRAGGRTVVVLGSGLSRPSPASHVRLFEEVLTAGGSLLSEWPMETEARPGHFPRRNRVIAGMARAVIVIAAGERSGAHITARLAVEELGRDVGAVPGSPDDPNAAGCLRLLREGAALLRHPEDAREMLAATTGVAMAARDAAARETGRLQTANGFTSSGGLPRRGPRPAASPPDPGGRAPPPPSP